MYLVNDKNTVTASAPRYDEPTYTAYIIPGKLYPAVAGKILNGTSHSGTYGDTAQTDGHKYYYTSIYGSKPINDPRIGAHFGSHRHKAKSIQLLEQETVAQGKNVYSVDGREWMRVVAGTNDVTTVNDNNDIGIKFGGAGDASNSFIEITGYFNNINMLSRTLAAACDDVKYYLNAASGVSVNTIAGDTTVSTPMAGRYQDASSVISLLATGSSLGTSPAINTIKLNCETGGSEVWYITGVELIAQDTTSTATKSQIQIPSQNVVSFGKKFTVADTPHYNPFAFKTDGTTAWTANNHNGTSWPVGTGSSANIDTTTSLGLEAWISTNYYYPYNGGRVVKWIASDGTIKTSVNMMPPNARNIKTLADNEKGDDSAGTSGATAVNDRYKPTFTDIAIDNSQAEIAKTFHWREFGNGMAGVGNGSYRDANMQDASNHDNAYCMDDGLTTYNCKNAQESVPTGLKNGTYVNGNASSAYYTFIGTGVSIYHNEAMAHGGTDDFKMNIDSVQVQTHVAGQSAAEGPHVYAQNLPYGSHTMRFERTVASSKAFIWRELSFHQPKMPPIPEEAVVIADYMLMADYVKQTDADPGEISKGIRMQCSTRDVYYNSSVTITSAGIDIGGYGAFTGMKITAGGGDAAHSQLPFFGTTGMYNGYAGSAALSLGGLATTEAVLDNSAGADGDIATITEIASTGSDRATLGPTSIIATVAAGSNIYAFQVDTPIHTSSHYQSFETPIEHLLVGGDRNMEQTNLVVTPDGKTWDEVTRDTSYIGNIVHRAGENGGTAENNFLIMDDRRGQLSSTGRNCVQKDFSMAYNRDICLRTGQYAIHAQTIAQSNAQSAATCQIYVNGAQRIVGHSGSAGHTHAHAMSCGKLKRGDYVQIKGAWHANHQLNGYWIERI